MFGECHAHLFMNGTDYKKAVMDHKGHPAESLVRAHLKAYQDRGITYVREGGDPYGCFRSCQGTGAGVRDHVSNLAFCRSQEGALRRNRGFCL